MEAKYDGQSLPEAKISGHVYTCIVAVAGPEFHFRSGKSPTNWRQCLDVNEILSSWTVNHLYLYSYFGKVE